MRDLLKRLAKMVAGYGAVQWAGPLLSLIFTPIITRILTVDDYGVSGYLQTVVTALSTVALFALPQALAAHFNDRPNEAAWQRQMTGSALALVVAFGLAIGAALVLLAPALGQWSPIIASHVPLVQFLGLALWVSLASTMLVNSAQAALRVRWGMAFSLTSIIGAVVFNLLFIVVLRLGVTGMLLTPLAVSASVFVVALLLMTRDPSRDPPRDPRSSCRGTRPRDRGRGAIGRPSSEAIKVLLRSGAVLLPTTLSVWSLTVVDRLFLGQTVSAAELGYYDIANKIAGLAYVAMAPLYTAWTPLALAMQHEAYAKVRYVNMSRYLIAAALMIGLFLGLFAIEILIVLTRPAYFPAAPYVGFLAYMHVFSAFGTVFTVGAMMGKQLKSVSAGVLLGAVVNIVLNALLIPRFGLWGATAATIVGFGVSPLVMYALVQRRYPIPYPLRRLLAALLIQFALLVMGLFVPALAFPIRIAVKLVIFATLPVSFVLLGVVTPFELNHARLFLRNQIRTRLSV